MSLTRRAQVKNYPEILILIKCCSRNLSISDFTKLLGAVTVIILKSPKKKSSFTESEGTTVAALYTITDYNGKIALFKRGYSMPVEIFDVNTNSLPQSDRELIMPQTYWKGLSCVRSDVRQALDRRLRIQ